MAIDRAEARRRVKTITGWAAAGAAALTVAMAFAAARGSNAAKPSTPKPAPTGAQDGPSQDVLPQQDETYPQAPQAGQGFAPPSASAAPPSATSGGS
jgi:Spy/CpxP family protein refolding chaperone